MKCFIKVTQQGKYRTVDGSQVKRKRSISPSLFVEKKTV